MLCYNCSDQINGSPWLHLRNIKDQSSDHSSDQSSDVDRGDKHLSDKHVCGYSCWKRLDEKGSLPVKLWPHIVNKSDYDGLIRPITLFSTTKVFEYLDSDEIDLLTDSERDAYFMEKEGQIEIDSFRDEIREEMNIEDARTAYIEDAYSESGYDDY